MLPLRHLAALPLAACLGLGACVAGDETEADPGEDADTVERPSAPLPAPRFGGRAGSGRPLQRETFTRWMKEASTSRAWDENGDGEISAGELARGAFVRWDANGDRVLSRVEWRAGAETWFAPEVARGTWAEWDEDDDRALHPAEVRRAFERKRLLQRVDRDRDATVSEVELFAWYFDVFDANGDGLVDADERRTGPAPGSGIASTRR